MNQNSKDFGRVREVRIDRESQSQRIDNYLITFLKGVPKSHIYRILRKGEVRVNKGRIKASYRLQAGDLLRIPPIRLADRPEREALRASDSLREQLEAAILYEDKRLLVLNKPSGMAVHGGSGLNYGVIEALRAIRPEQKELELVHRLDRDTSGCLLIAKRRSALRWLHQVIREDRVQKRYLALLTGSWPQDRLRVDAPLRKNTLQGGERVVRVDPQGKPALTLFQVQERYSGAMLVQADLKTGRTHQIRVHSAHLGTPILGDSKYGDETANREMRGLGLKRLFLHAEVLAFPASEEGPEIRVQAPISNELKSVLEKLRR